MPFQFSTAARNASLDAIETTIGASPTLELRSGAAPANCAAAASAGAKALLGTWQDLSADAAGTVGHFRVKQGATCHIQGSVTATGGGGDMTIDNPVLAVAQQVVVTAFNINAGGA
jgi:hypothetical protein